MAFLRYVDAPGIGGKVGTLLGEWGVNIGHMSVVRGKLGDQLRRERDLRRPVGGAAGWPARGRREPSLGLARDVHVA